MKGVNTIFPIHKNGIRLTISNLKSNLSPAIIVIIFHFTSQALLSLQ